MRERREKVTGRGLPEEGSEEQENSNGVKEIAKQPPGDQLVTAKRLLRNGRRSAGRPLVEPPQQRRSR